jgi:hypothetical protein
MPKSENAKLLDSLIDLYLSVKIRSNDEVSDHSPQLPVPLTLSDCD